MIDLYPNETFPIMLCLFILAFVVLSRLVLKPTLNLIEERRARSTGLNDKAADLAREYEKRVGQYEAGFNKARGEAAQAREKILQVSHQQEKSVLDGSRGEAEKTLSGLRQEISAEKTKGLEIIKTQSDLLAEEMVRKLLSL